MTRPVALSAPSYSVQPWATDTNYPAGSNPWNNQPLKVAPPSPNEGFVPDQGAPAEYFNWLLNAQGVRDQAVKDFLTDLTTFVNGVLLYTAEGVALNFLNRSTTPASGITSSENNACYSSGTWLVSTGAFSTDYGITWTNTLATVASGAGWSDPPCWVAGDNASNAVYASFSRYCYVNSGGSYSRVDVHGSAATVQSATVAYSPQNVSWAWAMITTTGNVFVRSSTDRTTWTSRTVPTGFSANENVRMVCIAETGRLILIGDSFTGNTVKVSHSDDGGVSWSAAITVTPAAVTIGELCLATDDASGQLLMILGQPTHSPPRCEVWTSVDLGVTWTKMISLNNVSLRTPGAVGGFWVTSSWNGTSENTAYTLDGGYTWKASGSSLDGSGRGTFGGAGGVLVLTSTYGYMSMRQGEPGLGNLS